MGKLTDRSFAPYVNLNTLIHIVNTGDTIQSMDGSSYKAPLSDLSPLFGGTSVTGLTFDNFTYDLSVQLSNNTSYTQNLSILASDIKVTGGTFNPNTGEILFENNSGGTFIVSGITFNFTGNTSASCITDLWISNLHGCSPITIHDGIQANGSSINNALSIAFGDNANASSSEVVNVPTSITIISACTFTVSDPNYSSPAIILNGDVSSEWAGYIYGFGSTFLVSGSSGTEILNNLSSVFDVYYDGATSTYIVDPGLVGSGYTLISGDTFYNVPTTFQRPSFAFGNNVTDRKSVV